MTRTIEKDVARAIRKCWPAKRKNSLVCLTEREFEARLDQIMAYLALSTSHQTVGDGVNPDSEKDRTGYSLATPEMRQYISQRLSSQWVRLIDDQTDSKSERIRHYPVAKTPKPAMKPKKKPAKAKKDGYECLRFEPGEARLRWKGEKSDGQ